MSDTVKIKRIEIINIVNVLSSMKGSYNNKLKYAIKRNKDSLTKIYENIQEESKTKVEKFADYEKERIEIISNYAMRDESNNIVLQDRNSVKIQEDKLDEFNIKMRELAEKHNETLKAKFEEEKRFNNVYLQEEIEVNLYKIENDVIPNDIEQEKYEILFTLIKDKE